MNQLEEVTLDGHSLTLQVIEKVFKNKNLKFLMSSSAREKMQVSRKYVLDIVEKGDPVYGINTGFGALSNRHIAKEDLAKLQLNLIRSHCTGVGTPLSKEFTKVLMIIRANCLVSGHSGINPEIIDLMIEFINSDIYPVIPEKGSVGASGDLAPLSHLALTLIGEGQVLQNDQIVSAKEAIHSIGKKPVVLGPKDGLALINGTSYMTALASFAVIEGIKLSKLFDVAGAMTVDGTRGTDAAFNANIHRIRPQTGQMMVASNLRTLLEGSKIRDSHTNCEKVQDSYSLRCMPQVHGACRQTINHLKEIIDIELNSVTDNPLIFPEDDLVVSGGNFHGEPLALAMDYMAMGLTELCSISERRCEKMMNPNFSSLPSFLVHSSGLNSGLMIAHVTHAALTSENKTMCFPASVDSIPTSTDKEDHVSMGPNAGHKLKKIIENAKHCLAIEFLCNTQAIDLLAPIETSDVLKEVHQLIRSHVPKIDEDRVFYHDMERIFNLIEKDSLLNLVEEKIGVLK